MLDNVQLLHQHLLLLSSATSSKGNALNLNRHALRQLINRNTAPRRLMREKLLIDPIHLHKIIHACQKHIDLDNLFNWGTGGFKDGGQVLDAEFSHGGDGWGREGKDFAAGSAGDLAGAVNCRRSCYCLGLAHVRGDTWGGNAERT